MSFKGKGSTSQLEESRKCPKCQKKGDVYYIGSDVLRGNPYSPAADTEVEHHYECKSCGAEWSELV